MTADKIRAAFEPPRRRDHQWRRDRGPAEDAGVNWRRGICLAALGAVAFGGGSSAVAQTTWCNPIGGSIVCNTTPAPAPSPQLSDSMGNFGAALGNAIALGAERREQRRLEKVAGKVAALITQHDCAGAKELALKENAPEMAARVPRFCKTLAQIGEQPTYLATPTKDGMDSWIFANIRHAAGVQLWAYSPDQIAWVQSVDGAGRWIHFEALSLNGEAQIGGRSALWLFQANCSSRQTQWAAVTHYAGSNLTGEPTASDTPSGWTYPRPNTIGVTWLGYACDPGK